MTRKSGIIFLLWLITSAFALGTAVAGEAIKGSAKAESMQQCVRPNDFMRRNHFEVIKHQRNLTVHEGIRKTTDSLAGCVDCHARKDAEGKAVPVNAEGQFCDACHDYVAVNIDCFSCHTAIPGGM